MNVILTFYHYSEFYELHLQAGNKMKNTSIDYFNEIFFS